ARVFVQSTRDSWKTLIDGARQTQWALLLNPDGPCEMQSVDEKTGNALGWWEVPPCRAAYLPKLENARWEIRSQQASDRIVLLQPPNAEIRTLVIGLGQSKV